MAEIIPDPDYIKELEQATESSDSAADGVQFTFNSIDATEMKGGFLGWRLTGIETGPLVVPARQKTVKMTLPANVLVAMTKSGFQRFIYTRRHNTLPGKEGPVGPAELVPYEGEEDIILKGPENVTDSTADEGRGKEEISMTGTKSGLLTFWVSRT